MQVMVRRTGKIEIASKTAGQLAGLCQFGPGKGKRGNTFHAKDRKIVLAMRAHADSSVGTVVENGLQHAADHMRQAFAIGSEIEIGRNFIDE